MTNELATKINNYIGDLGVAYIKFHNLHWNVEGPNFKGIHEYFEEIYDEITEYLDEAAELLKQHDFLPLATLKDFLANSSIKEIESKKIDVKQAISIAIDDIQILKGKALEIHNEAEKTGLFVASNMAQDHVTTYDKTVWFLKATLA